MEWVVICGSIAATACFGWVHGRRADPKIVTHDEIPLAYGVFIAWAAAYWLAIVGLIFETGTFSFAGLFVPGGLLLFAFFLKPQWLLFSILVPIVVTCATYLLGKYSQLLSEGSR